MKQFDLLGVLNFIDPTSCSYQEWLQVGMALQKEGYPLSAWDNWSALDSGRYHQDECSKKWEGFRGSPNPVTGATITMMAKDRGWKPKDREAGRALSWDDEIREDPSSGIIINTKLLEGEAFREPQGDWKPVQEIITFLRTLFDASDHVGYVNESMRKDDTDKFIPANGGYTSRTSSTLITQLEKCNGDIGAVFGDYNPEAGMWIRINALDGHGVNNENVTAFKYALVECDDLSLAKQNEAIRKLQLPVATLTYSGAKSIHAIVKIDAANAEEYRQRVEFLYKICEKNGLTIDTANKNPSRLSRLPGVKRGGKKQFLIGTNLGKESWDEWREWIENTNDDMPVIKNLGMAKDKGLPPKADELIHGVLRQGHKMLIAGPSKAGKSFALIELAMAIASGTTWLGHFPCERGKVLYVNLEIDEPSCFDRFDVVGKALGIGHDADYNVEIWNLRGKSVPMDKLAPKIIARAQESDYMAIIIDPIYKVITGDENSADQMAHFCNQFDKICTELGCAVIYCHHHSKGGQGLKKSMDRASGSGVFARDPDAMLDMIQLKVKDQDPDDIATAWRITGTLREFPSFPPVNVFFRYPVHVADDTDMLKDAMEEGSLADVYQKGREQSNKAKKEEAAKNVDSVEIAFEAYANEAGKAKLSDMARYFSKSERTVKNYINQNGGFKVKNGLVERISDLEC